MTPDRILEVVAQHYGLWVSDLKHKNKFRRVSFARQVAMFVLRQNRPEMSYKDIGAIFGHHHTTTMHGVKKIDRIVNANGTVPAREIQDLVTLTSREQSL